MAYEYSGNLAYWIKVDEGMYLQEIERRYLDGRSKKKKKITLIRGISNTVLPRPANFANGYIKTKENLYTKQ